MPVLVTLASLLNKHSVRCAPPATRLLNGQADGPRWFTPTYSSSPIYNTALDPSPWWRYPVPQRPTFIEHQLALYRQNHWRG
ncbi:hypothetical protein M3J09_006473 [Ascochyta lentis]